jgi:circadian clock protein KaiB
LGRARKSTPGTFQLLLYVTGRAPPSARAIANLQDICNSHMAGAAYSLEVVDVLKDPQRAETDKILATPMLIRRKPPPVRRILGDLSDTSRVLRGLDLPAAAGGISPSGK